MEDRRATYNLLYYPTERIDWSLVHQASPSCITFSPSGKYLASGGGDGVLAIWSLSTSKPHYIFRGDVAITCIKWRSQDTFLFGRKDGTVCCGEIHKNLKEIAVVTFEPLGFPIYHLDHQEPWCAFAGERTIQPWVMVTGNWKILPQLPFPARLRGAEGSESCVSSLHWLENSEFDCQSDSKLLLASYLHDGIIIWDVVSRTIIRTINTAHRIHSTTISSDCTFLALSRSGGIDVYHLSSGTPTASYPPGGQESIAPVLFVHEGRALIAGATQGGSHLFDATSGSAIQHLYQPQIGGGADVISTSAWFSQRKKGEGSYIGLGTSTGFIQIWEAGLSLHPKISIARQRLDSSAPARLTSIAPLIFVTICVILSILLAKEMTQQEDRTQFLVLMQRRILLYFS